MVIPTDPAVESKFMALKGNGLKAGNFKWSERPARLQHRFLVLRKLGQGTYGKVQLALNKETNQEVAIKTIKKARIESEEDMLRIRREIHIMTSIRHPHIIHITEVFETRQKIVIVMQYASGGELYDYLGCHHTLPEGEARRLFRQIASAIYYCHKNKICHRDLKLENILLDEEGNAQIADFGLSNIFDDRRRMNTFCGSPLYASPEIVKGTPYKGPEVDCWSLGVLLYTLIYGTMPFDGRNFKELVSQISEGRYEEPICKSNASGLIRRLLTPDISKRATILDVCKDSWVNQGYEESLLNKAECVATESLFKVRKLGTAKSNSEKIINNESEKPSFSEASGLEQHNERTYSCIVNENFKNSNSNNFQIPQKVSLYEQMLNYDVKFIINKLLTAVESGLNCQKLETKTSISTSTKEKTLSNFKHWPRNGENNLSSKVDSAYVIPIFEVTSVVPKIPQKIITNHINEESHTQNNIPNGFVPVTSEIESNKEAKSNKAKTKKKEILNQTQQLSSATKNLNSIEILNHNNLKIIPDFTDSKTSSPVSIMAYNETSETRDNVHVKRLINHEGISSRNPSIKAKRAYENSLFGQKHISPFFRSKNNALSLARIFSMNYEKLILNNFKLPERKQKPPGKIVIPATFDPSALPSDSSTQERKQIVVFPTISVSENKEKIEKKIDKIKKAALNMNLIRRSNSKNRLRIQKFLKSQAKKMQDLVCDEQRSIAGSMEHINKCEGFSIPDAYFSKFEGGNFNAFNIKMHNKKINFMYSNECNSTSPLTWYVSSEENWKFGSIGSNMVGQTCNLGLFSITKSESDSQCSLRYRNNNVFSTSLSSSVDTQFGNFLTVPNSNCNIKLIRSASDSKGMNAYRKTSGGFDTDKKHGKYIYLDGSLPPLKVETSCFDADYLNGQSTKYSDCKNLKIKHDGYPNNLNLNEVIDKNEPFKSKILSTTLNANKSDEKNLIHRSISMNSCSNYQIIDEVDFSDSKYLDSSSFHENGNHCDTNNLSKLGCNMMGKTQLPWLESEINEMHYEADEKQNVLRRRNTLSCVPVCPNDITYPDLRNAQEKCVNNSSDLYYYPWVHHSEQDLADQQKIDTKFSSSPNLCQSSLRRKLTEIKINDSKSIDSLNPRLNNCNLNETSFNPILPSVQASSEKSKIIRQILYGSHQEPSSHDYALSRKNRAKSVIEDAFWQAGIDNALRTTQSEKNTPLPQTSQNNQKRSAFLSKFLNELENREQLSSAPNNNVAQRHFSPRAFSLGKRSKSEKRKQSFLQLLSLKRIQEAEKELDKADRDIKIDAEEEDSAGSLLEALKTHGYKGVISQRFQGSEDNSLDTFNLKNPNSPFLSRKLSSDMSRLNAMYYDTLPHLSTPTYDVTEWDTLGRYRMRSPYEMHTGYLQNSPKQSVYDWLTVNQNGDLHTPFTVDQDLILDPEISDSSLKEMENSSNWGKETSRSFDDEISSSESLDAPKDQYINGRLGNETCKTRECFTDYDELPNSGRIERNPLLRTSSTSEDEREESVQDRIWRKSFYSRFNNSALSRKERSTYLESQFPSESRVGFNRNSPIVFKAATRDSPDSIKWNGYTSDVPSKRIHESKKYPSTNDNAATCKATVKSPRTSRQTSLETTYMNGDTSVKTKLEDAEPEH